MYFHGADAGLKRELAESNPVIGFEIDNGGVMGRAEKACDYTEYYHSIIGSGRSVGGKRQGREEKDPYDFHGMPG